MGFFFSPPLNGKTTFVKEMRYLWTAQKLFSVTFGAARLQPFFWKGSLGKDRASFPLVGIRGKEEGKNQIIRFHTGIKTIT